MIASSSVFLYAVGRTPFGKFLGSLAGYSPAELGAFSIDELVSRAMLPSDAVSRVNVGTAMIGGGSITAARQMVLGSKLPDSTPSLGVDRACCSGMSAIGTAAAQIMAGETGLVIAGGVEVLSRTPRFLERTVPKSGQLLIDDPLLLNAPFGDSVAGYTSQEALKAGIDREAQDAWAIESHERYFRAEQDGFFAFERFPAPARPAGGRTSDYILAADENPREDSSAKALAALPTVRGSATITAGNAPGLSDGAAFVLLGSAEAGRAHGLEPVAELAGITSVAEGPTSGTRTPAIAILKLIERHGISLENLAVIEINEAFAATPLVSTLVLAGFDVAKAESLRQKMNPNGGAVAIGHPMGASGARIVMTAVAELRRRGGGIGVAAICGGFGQGEAVMVKV